MKAAAPSLGEFARESIALDQPTGVGSAATQAETGFDKGRSPTTRVRPTARANPRHVNLVTGVTVSIFVHALVLGAAVYCTLPAKPVAPAADEEPTISVRLVDAPAPRTTAGRGDSVRRVGGSAVAHDDSADGDGTAEPTSEALAEELLDSTTPTPTNEAPPPLRATLAHVRETMPPSQTTSSITAPRNRVVASSVAVFDALPVYAVAVPDGFASTTSPGSGRGEQGGLGSNAAGADNKSGSGIGRGETAGGSGAGGDGSATSGGTRGPGRIGGGGAGVSVIELSPPDYPASALRAGEEGVVVLDLEVLPTGRVGAIEVVEGADHLQLTAAAMEVVRRARFQPAMERGRAVAAHVRLPFHFVLRRGKQTEAARR